MNPKAISARIALFAVLAAGAAVTFGQAQAASEQTRRNSNTIQNYQNRQQAPYYSGQTNPYYGTSTQSPQVNRPSPPPASNTLQNQIRRNEGRNGQ